MKAFNVTTVAQTAIAAGPLDFIAIYNNSDTTVYLKFDGDSDTVTTANGYPLVAGAQIILTNDGYRNVFKHGVQVIHGASGNKEIRIQGAE